MDLQEFKEQIESFIEQAAGIGYEMTAGENWLQPDMEHMDDLDQVVERIREFWLRDQMTEEVAWNACVTFGILYGETLVRQFGCGWILNDEGLPVLEAGGAQFSPIMEIQKFITDEDDSKGRPSQACQGFIEEISRAR